MQADARLTDSAARDPGPFDSLRQDFPSALLGLFLLAVPLYRSKVLEDSFNTPKLALVIVMGVITAIAVLSRSSAARLPLRWYAAPWLMVVFAAWQAVSALWAESKPLAVDGTVYFAAFAVLCWLFVRGPVAVAGVRGLFHCAAAAAVATAVWVLWDDFAGGERGIVAKLPDWRGLLSAGLGNSGHIAGMVGMLLPWLLLLFVRRKASGTASWIVVLGILLSFAALTITWSVGSCGATILSLLIWGLIAWKTLPAAEVSWQRLIWPFVAGLLVIGFYFTPNPLNPHSPSIWKQAFSSQRWEDGWPTRLVIWETTWHMIKQMPLVGMGTGNFTFLYAQQVVPSVLKNPALAVYAGSFTNEAHNDYMQVWAEGGAAALALWVAILSSFYVQIGRMLRVSGRTPSSDERMLLLAAGAGLTVFALDGLMSFPMRLPAHFAMAMFFLAVPGMLVRLRVPLVGGANTHCLELRRWRAGGVGVLLTLAACMWHMGHRVVAEYYLKAGRDVAESNLLLVEGRPYSPWGVCQTYYESILTDIATGTTQTLKPSVMQMRAIAHQPEMKTAREFIERSVAADRWYANASSRLGQLLLFQSDWSESMAVSRRTLKTLEAFEVHERYGLAAYLTGDKKLAREQWSICRERIARLEGFYSDLVEAAKD